MLYVICKQWAYVADIQLICFPGEIVSFIVKQFRYEHHDKSGPVQILFSCFEFDSSYTLCIIQT